MRNFGSDIFYEDTNLIVPADKYFPDKIENVNELAERIFSRVKEYAGMSEWQCELQAQDPDVNPMLAPTLVIQNAPRGPAGTFSVVDEGARKIVITYNPSQLNHPEGLVATFAHELAHYLSLVANEPPPGGEELSEPATDLLATFMGFGLFLANSAFDFRQYTAVDSQGWSAKTQGYLSQYELTYALAIFSVLKQVPTAYVQHYLKPTLRSYYGKALREVQAKTVELEKLRAISCLMKNSAGH